MANLAPLPAFSSAQIKAKAATNRRIGTLYGVSTVPWLDRHYNGTGDPRLVVDTAKIQRLLGLPPTGILSAETLARMLAHVRANTEIGAALRRNFVFPGIRIGARYNIRRPTDRDLQVARFREVYLKMPQRAKRALVSHRGQPQRALVSHRGQPQRALVSHRGQPQRALVSHRGQQQRALVSHRGQQRPATRTAPVVLSRPLVQRPLLFSPGWWQRFRTAQAQRRYAPPKTRCVCGATRNDLQAKLNRLWF